MHTSRRGPKLLLAATVAAMLAAALLGAAAASAQEVVTYTPESLGEYSKQLSSGQVRAVAVNKKARHLHVTLKNGRLMLVSYEPGEEAKLVAQARGRRVSVTVLAPAAVKPKKKAVHHKLRYIAGGILIVVIVVVGAVLLIDRRRKAAVE